MSKRFILDAGDRMVAATLAAAYCSVHQRKATEAYLEMFLQYESALAAVREKQDSEDHQAETAAELATWAILGRGGA
jgi:hypothetical protein